MSNSDDFTNDFSWSANRSSVFQECKRKYYLQYYGFWGGWNRSSDEQTRQIYVLKKLQNRYMWVGIAVHETVEHILKHLRGGRVLSRENVVEDMLNNMREQFRESREGKYKIDPKNTTGLTEHEYGVDLPDSEWETIRNRGKQCVNNFYNLDLFRELQSSPPEEWLAIEGDLNARDNTVDSFNIGNLKIWLKLDFAYRNGDRVHIVDWKTGHSDPDFRQLYCYGYYAWKEWGFQPEQVDLKMVNLLEPDITAESLSMDKLEQLEREIQEDVVSMKDLLVNPEENTARMEDFPKVDDLSTCRRCRFRKICYPDGVPSK